MNQTVHDLSNKTFDGKLSGYIYTFACGPVTAIGFILCLICILIFSSAEFKDQKLFTYLKFECLFMLIDNFICFLPAIFTDTFDSSISKFNETLLSKVINLYLYYFLASVLEFCALLSSIFVALSCYAMLHSLNQSGNRGCFAFLATLSPYKTTLFGFIISIIVFIYQPFCGHIQSSENVQNNFITIDFFESNLQIFELVTFTIRDGLLLAILLTIDCLLVVKIKKNLNHKMSTMGNKNANTIVNRTRESHNHLTKMILVDCTNSIVGRLPILAYFIVKNVFPSIILEIPLSSVCSLAVYVSYSVKFFIYYNFNKNFKKVFLKHIQSIKTFFIRHL